MIDRIFVTDESQVLATEAPRWKFLVGLVLRRLLLASFIAVALWLLACIASTYWLAWTVPISDSDLKDSSWLQYTTPMYASFFMVRTVAVLMVLLGVVLGILSHRPFLIVFALLGAVSLVKAVSNESNFRIAVAADWARVGCFNFKSKECLEMLGMPAEGAPSRYQLPTEKNGWSDVAPWYAAETVGLGIPTVHQLPMGPFLSAPFYLMDSASINDKLNRQRSEVASFRQSKTPPQPLVSTGN